MSIPEGEHLLLSLAPAGDQVLLPHAEPDDADRELRGGSAGPQADAGWSIQPGRLALQNKGSPRKHLQYF